MKNWKKKFFEKFFEIFLKIFFEIFFLPPNFEFPAKTAMNFRPPGSVGGYGWVGDWIKNGEIWKKILKKFDEINFGEFKLPTVELKPQFLSTTGSAKRYGFKSKISQKFDLVPFSLFKNYVKWHKDDFCHQKIWHPWWSSLWCWFQVRNFPKIWFGPFLTF